MKRLPMKTPARLWFVGLFAAVLLPAAAHGQIDFSNAVAVKIRTYPVKRDNGKVVPAADGMPQPESMQGKQPANLIELPAVPVNPMFPGGSILDSLVRYQKHDAVAALAAMIALLKNGYMELDLEKVCSNDAIKLQYTHRGTMAAPNYQEAGLTALKQIVADGVKAEELERARSRLRDRYNAGLSPDRKKDQEMIQFLDAKRLAIAMRYNPRLKNQAFASVARRDAKERFKQELAKGKPVDGDLAIGPVELTVRMRLARIEKKPVPAACRS
jgi:hypothetical protein